MRKNRKIFYALYLLQIAFILIVWLENASFNSLGSTFISLGSIAGLLAGFSFLYQLILISGANFFEKYFGLDRLSRLHHKNGFIGYFLVLAHINFMVLGYSKFTELALQDQFIELRELPGVALASLGVFLLNAVIITSIFAVKKRLKYEIWYYIHLAVYASVLLAVFHQVQIGTTINSSPLLKNYWILLYIVAFAMVLWRRWGLMIFNEYKYRFRVASVKVVEDKFVSVKVKSNSKHKYRYRAGQFNLWWILQKGLGSSHHPFSISSSPEDDYIEFTAKKIGDMTSSLPKLKKGTVVLVGGPYGVFTDRGDRERLFIAGGIGVTPIRSIINDSTKKGDYLIYACQSKADQIFKDEFDSNKKLKTKYLLSEDGDGYVDKKLLKSISNIKNRNVWLCGPPSMIDAVEKQLLDIGLDKSQIITEKFSL